MAAQHHAKNPETCHAWLVGGGISSLSAAVFLIRDAGFRPANIHVLESSDRLGGSLDGAGTPDDGYVIRGGRMFEKHFGCTFDLFESIPAATNRSQSVTQETIAFTRKVVTSSNCRIVRNGKRIEAPEFQLTFADRAKLAKLALQRERSLGTLSIEDYFSPHFFETNFWIMWSTMFAFQPWHAVIEFRRYMRRFMHLLPGFNRLEGIHRTVYNQYDSLISPLESWLRERGIDFQLQTQVTDIDFDWLDGHHVAQQIHANVGGEYKLIPIAPSDIVFITLGSMTDLSTLGSMKVPPPVPTGTSGSWNLWKNIASKSDSFGHPNRFCSDITKTNWESFTVTLRDSRFFDFMKQFTGNDAGTGGLITFADSNWLMSIVLAHQPHFINQPSDTYVFWGYGLFTDRVGNHVKKRMMDCCGSELLAELSFHLRLGDHAESYFASANCIPCMMPFITSQFMPRMAGDRPEVVLANAGNFAFLGQFCEIPDDVVFTVEYSIRSAQRAVYSLFDTGKRETHIYLGSRDPAALLRGLLTMLRNGSSSA